MSGAILTDFGMAKAPRPLVGVKISEMKSQGCSTFKKKGEKKIKTP